MPVVNFSLNKNSWPYSLKDFLIKTGILFFIILLYTFLCGFVQRHETLPLLSLYTILFGAFLFVYRHVKLEKDLRFWLAGALLIRIVPFFFWPSLSEDVYRYLWDGHLFSSGIHPFQDTPENLLHKTPPISSLDPTLFTLLNSPEYYTVYPPLAQYLFLAVTKITSSYWQSITLLRFIYLATETGSLFLLLGILNALNLDRKKVLLYALNPLVVLEIMNNLHLEVFVVFFLLLSIYALLQKQMIGSALSFSGAILMKLIPAMLFPLFFHALGWKKGIAYFLILALSTWILSLPLLDWDIIHGYQTGIGYFFNKFEFNASLYFLVRDIGIWWQGYNPIAIVGKAMGLISMVTILVYSFYSKDGNYFSGEGLSPVVSISHLRKVMDVFFIYFIFTTTLHPWYLIPFLAVSLFLPYFYPLLWSYLIFLSYAGYTENGYHPFLGIIGFEYVLVYGLFFTERIWKKSFSF